MLAVKHTRGFSLIELVVVIAILGFLLASGLPFIADTVRDSKIRGASESVVSALRISQSEALKRNAVVRFQLVTNLENSCALSATGSAWVVSQEVATGKCDVSDTEVSPFPIRRDGGLNASAVAIEADGTGAFCFSGLGRPTTTSANCNTTTSERYDIRPVGAVCKADGGSARCLRITVSATGTVRMCDPAVTTLNDPRLC